MCARYSITEKSLERLVKLFKINLIRGQLKLNRYNAAPTQDLPVLFKETSSTILSPFRWGLIPSWAQDPSIGVKMMNARAETLSEKVSFKGLIKSQRCLVIADGFYEWRVKDGEKTPIRICLKDHSLFSFAGLWDQWRAPNGSEVRTFTIITTASQSHSLMAPIHDRMPVILSPESQELWLKSDLAPSDLMSRALKQYPAELMKAYEVSRLVNSVRNDVEGCVEEAEPRDNSQREMDLSMTSQLKRPS